MPFDDGDECEKASSQQTLERTSARVSVCCVAIARDWTKVSPDQIRGVNTHHQDCCHNFVKPAQRKKHSRRDMSQPSLRGAAGESVISKRRCCLTVLAVAVAALACLSAAPFFGAAQQPLSLLSQMAALTGKWKRSSKQAKQLPPDWALWRTQTNQTIQSIYRTTHAQAKRQRLPSRRL